MGRKLTYNPDKPTIGSQLEKPATGNEPASSVFARMSGRPAPAAATPTAASSASTTSTPAAKPATATPAAKSAAAPKTAAAPAAKPSAAAAPVKQTFKQAFTAARQAAGGAGGKFTYGGKQFQTNVAGEKYKAASSLKSVDTAKPASTPAPAASDVKSTGPEFPKAKASPSTAMPPRRPSMGPEAPAPESKPEPVAPSGVNTPNVSSPSAKPTAMAPDVGRSSPSAGSGSNISVAPEKSSAASPPPEEKKKAPTPAPATTAVEHRLSESVVSVGSNKYRIV